MEVQQDYHVLLCAKLGAQNLLLVLTTSLFRGKKSYAEKKNLRAISFLLIIAVKEHMHCKQHRKKEFRKFLKQTLLLYTLNITFKNRNKEILG